MALRLACNQRLFVPYGLLTDGCLISSISLEKHFQPPHPVFWEFNQIWDIPSLKGQVLTMELSVPKRQQHYRFIRCGKPGSCTSGQSAHTVTGNLQQYVFYSDLCNCTNIYAYTRVLLTLSLLCVLIPNISACNIAPLGKCFTKLYGFCYFPRVVFAIFIFFRTSESKVRTGTMVHRVGSNTH